MITNWSSLMRFKSKNMTMFYPLLNGFWASTGLSTAILFTLLFCQGKYNYHDCPFWVSALVALLVYASPLLGILYTRGHFTKKERRTRTVRPLMRQCVTGAVIGAIVALTAATLLLPLLMRG
jgi:hypothetical protein